MVYLWLIDRKKLKTKPEDLLPKVRQTFLSMLINIFKKYQDFLDETKYEDPNIDHYFDKAKFLESQKKEYREFITQFMETQIFQRFLYKRVNPQTTEDILQNKYFDESIIAASYSSDPFKVYIII